MAGLYLVGAWLVVQVAGTVLPMFGAPEWLPRTIVILLAIGFVPAMIFSWVFEVTPEGLKRDADVPLEQSIAPQTARRMDRMIIVALVLALGYFAFDKFVLTPRREAALVASAGPNASKSVVNAKSIAVLPFENLSEEKANAYFAEGIQNEILTKLAMVRDLKVISRTSTAKYGSKPDNLKTVATELGVATLLEEAVQKSGDKVRVNVQLIDARTDSHLWAKTFDRDFKNVFAVESEVAQEIADTLQAKLSPSESHALASVPTQDPQAYDQFLQGEYQLRAAESVPVAETYARAERFYRQAIARDPRFAQAYAALAYCSLSSHWFLSRRTPAQLAEVKALVDRALNSLRIRLKRIAAWPSFTTGATGNTTRRWPNSTALSISNQITRRRSNIAPGYFADRANGNSFLVKGSWHRSSIPVTHKFQQTSRSELRPCESGTRRSVMLRALWPLSLIISSPLTLR